MSLNTLGKTLAMGFFGTATALYANSKAIKQEADLSSDADIQKCVKTTYGVKNTPSIFNFTRTIFGMIGNYTVMLGARTQWDKERLLKGKFNQMQKIGGDVVILNTDSCDQIVGCFFRLSTFFQKLKEMGGRCVTLSFELQHPFFQRIKPVTITATHSN